MEKNIIKVRAHDGIVGFTYLLSIIGAIIELYVVATDFQNTNFQIADIENIEL